MRRSPPDGAAARLRSGRADAQLVIGDHHVLAIGGTRDEPFVIGAQAGALRPLDLEGEVAIEQVAELNVGQSEIVAAEIRRVGEPFLGDIEIAVEDADAALEARWRRAPPQACGSPARKSARRN